MKYITYIIKQKHKKNIHKRNNTKTQYVTKAQ